ncbi:hypothetical protein ABZY45_25025 [Streptomyces sp. NPDC006516]|uniref:hypothetical protein n=1 Tax=Streptomyces sp. NPDC006516 TaxID=3154309 RepID=UPI0033B392BC
MQFTTELMNGGQGWRLDRWIEAPSLTADLLALHGFGNGLGQDLDAVVAGLAMRKRQAFGRANFDLLANESCLL